jgi:hypothetical protein
LGKYPNIHTLRWNADKEVLSEVKYSEEGPLDKLCVDSDRDGVCDPRILGDLSNPVIFTKLDARSERYETLPLARRGEGHVAEGPLQITAGPPVAAPQAKSEHGIERRDVDYLRPEHRYDDGIPYLGLGISYDRGVETTSPPEDHNTPSQEAKPKVALVISDAEKAKPQDTMRREEPVTATKLEANHNIKRPHTELPVDPEIKPDSADDKDSRPWNLRRWAKEHGFYPPFSHGGCSTPDGMS